MLELDLLGQSRAVLDGQELHLPTRKTLALLAYLALEGSTPRTRLAGLFWSENTDEDARRNLRRELHRLRQAGLRGRISADGERIGLSGPLMTDVERFEAALEAGHLEAALGLHRGELLEGLMLEGSGGFEEWLEVRRARLNDTRRRGMLELAEHLETRGDWRRALELHLRLLGEDALQERQHREVMRLHYLLGEREAALTQFERCRTTLGAELGLEPLPETLALAERIRTVQTLEPRTSDRPKPQPGTNPFSHLPLVGREAAQQKLEAHRRAGRMVFVSGEPGVGKSSLIREFAAARGRFALIEARSSDALMPFASLSRTIQQTLTARPDLELPTWMRRELSRLLPELSPEPPSPPRSLEERQYLYRAFTEWLQLAFQDAASLVIDDLQFFDTPSLEMLLQAAEGFSDGRHRHVLASFRQAELSPEAQAMLDRFVSDGRAALLELEPLSPRDLEQLVQAATGASAGSWIAQLHRVLHRATGGNPFYALETVRGLLESGRLQPEAPQTTDLPIPQTVREAVSNRLKHLPVGSQRLLEAASLAGDGFGLESLSGATALSEWESLEALEQAVGAGVLEPFGAGHRFVHDLIRQAVQDQLGAERSRLLHRSLARSLERQNGAPARIADHLERGGLEREAAPWHVKAARLAAGMFANDAALEHTARALEIGLDDTDAFAVRLLRLGVFELLDDAERRARELDAMDVLATRLGDDALMAEVTLGRARLERNLGHYERALELSRSVTPPKAGAQTGTLMAQADFQAGAALMRLGRLIEAEDRFRQALEHLPRGMTALRADVNDLLCTCALRQGKLEAAGQWAEAARRAFDALEQRAGQLKARLNLGLIAGLGGDLTEAITIFEGVRTEAAQIGHLLYQRHALGNLAHFALIGGEYERARTALDESLALAREPRDPLLETTLLYNLGIVQCAEGQLGAALESLRAAARIAEETNSGQHLAYRQMALAELHLELGDPLGAQGALLSARDLVRTLRLDAIRLEIETLFARWEALRGQHDTALARLQGATGVAQEDVSREDRERALYVLACLTLRHAPDEACLLLEPLSGSSRSSHSRLNRARLLTVQLQAQAAGYAVLARLDDALEEAARLLRAPLMPSNEFDLRRAVIRALGHAGLTSRAEAERILAASRIRALSASLEAHPDLRLNFIRLHEDFVPDGVV